MVGVNIQCSQYVCWVSRDKTERMFLNISNGASEYVWIKGCDKITAKMKIYVHKIYWLQCCPKA